MKACALGQASSSIMARHVVGATRRAARITRNRAADAEGQRPAAVGRMGRHSGAEVVRDYKARHASTLLTFDAVVSAIDQIEGKARSRAAAS